MAVSSRALPNTPYFHCHALTFTPEALDHVEARRRGEREVHVKTQVLGKPRVARGIFMRGNVVAVQMQRFILLGFLVDLAQGYKPLLVAMKSLANGNGRPIQRAERREQRRGTVSIVVVGYQPDLSDWTVKLVPV
ncbi:MAG: hypothetical protein ACYDDO_08370 [Acidiferrobacterales bacterium]